MLFLFSNFSFFNVITGSVLVSDEQISKRFFHFFSYLRCSKIILGCETRKNKGVRGTVLQQQEQQEEQEQEQEE